MSESTVAERLSVQDQLKARRKAEAAAKKAEEAAAAAAKITAENTEVVVTKKEKENEMGENTQVVTVDENGEVLVNGSVQDVPQQRPSTGTTSTILETSPLRVTLADVVIMTAERGYRDYNEVVAILDCVNPQFIILEDVPSNNASNIALSWAKSRDREFKIMAPKWGLTGDPANATAGPLRNQEVLKFARTLIAQEGVKVWQLVFTDGHYDRAVENMLNLANAKNEMLETDRNLQRFVIPQIRVSAWLQADAITSGAQLEVAEGVYAPIPEPMMRVGAREVEVQPNF